MKHIFYETDGVKYFDKNGIEIKDGDSIKLGGKIQKVYKTVEGELGTDATNPLWIETGRACECEYGIYPLTEDDLEEAEKVEA